MSGGAWGTNHDGSLAEGSSTERDTDSSVAAVELEEFFLGDEESIGLADDQISSVVGLVSVLVTRIVPLVENSDPVLSLPSTSLVKYTLAMYEYAEYEYESLIITKFPGNGFA